MILTIVSLLIVVACIAGIVHIISRRWNALLSIDLEALPAERDARTKKKIIAERLKRQMYHAKNKATEISEPLKLFFRKRFSKIQEKVHTLSEAVEHHRSKTESSDEKMPDGTRVEKLLREADTAMDQEKFDEAERKYIDIIALDAKNLQPYQGLALLYTKKKDWPQAQEVLEYLCNQLRELASHTDSNPSEKSSLEMRLAESLNQLSGVTLSQEKNDEACSALEEAVALQPQNPKFLDALLELYIILGKQKEARKVLARLKEANPENQKLDEFAERIKAL